MDRRQFDEAYLRNFVFGVEDSLVSTVGLVAGIAAAGVAQGTILVTGIVLIFVEAFSMGVGSFLSERSAGEYMKRTNDGRKSSLAAIIMVVSYFLAGFIPLGPYAILTTATAFWVSIALSVAALFFLGVASARISGSSVMATGFRMALLGGIAIIIGVAVGVAFRTVL